MIASALLTPEYSGSKEHPISHRNGGGGNSFLLYLTEDTLYLKFQNEPDYKAYRLSDFAFLVNCPFKGKAVKSHTGKVRLRDFSSDGDTILYAYTLDKANMIGIYNPELNEEYMSFAAFDWGLLLEGDMRFAFNSYYGENVKIALDICMAKNKL